MKFCEIMLAWCYIGSKRCINFWVYDISFLLPSYSHLSFRYPSSVACIFQLNSQWSRYFMNCLVKQNLLYQKRTEKWYEIVHIHSGFRRILIGHSVFIAICFGSCWRGVEICYEWVKRHFLLCTCHEIQGKFITRLCGLKQSSKHNSTKKGQNLIQNLSVVDKQWFKLNYIL